jgi:hypothetical protein
MKKISIVLACVCALPSYGGGFVSVFGDQLVAQRENQVLMMFQYGIPTDMVDISAVTTGSTSAGPGSAILSTGASATGELKMSSKKVLHYSPGYEGDAFFTGAFTTGVANSIQYIGLFDDNDGWAVGYQGTQFGVLFRRDNGTDQFIPQASFNLDPIDGSGPSGFAIDPTKINLFRISYGWLGAAPITYQVCSPTGTWISFHRINYPNTQLVPHVENASLPIRAQVKNTGNTSNLSLITASWNASIAGDIGGLRQFEYGAEAVTLTTNVDTPLFTIRNKPTFPTSNPQLNKTTVKVIFGTFATESSSLVLFKFIKNGTLTGASYTDYSPEESVVQVDASATAITGGKLAYATNAAQGSIRTTYFQQEDFDVSLRPGETLTVTGKKTGGVVDVDAYIMWDEIY